MEKYLTGRKPTSTEAVILILTSDNQKRDCSHERKDVYDVPLWQCKQVLCGCVWRGGGRGTAEYCFIFHMCVEGLKERSGIWTQSSEEQVEFIFCGRSAPDWCRAHRIFWGTSICRVQASSSPLGVPSGVGLLYIWGGFGLAMHHVTNSPSTPLCFTKYLYSLIPVLINWAEFNQ